MLILNLPLDIVEKIILIPDNASWYTAIRSESLIKINSE